MQLIERDKFFKLLQRQLQNVAEGEGHCIFISGEAGIGKTSLIKALQEENKTGCVIYQGACDALFTPRPLAPLYDIMWQINGDLWGNSHAIGERSELFTSVFRELSKQDQKTIIVFEDIHWADEATLDFIKFFARRIAQLRCLFILTYRDDEIHSRHPLKNVLGQAPPDSFTRLKLTPLSRSAVEKMAAEKGYNGEDVYSISGGNPFYVNEILASYSLGIPDNIKDSILSVYNRQDEETKYVWKILSILPAGIDIKYFEKTEPSYAACIQKSLDTTILVLRKEMLFFKHELYRRTIEASLSPVTRIAYNKKVLDVFIGSYEKNQEIERIVHLAKNANDYDTVVRYAPLAASQAAAVGAHIEASRLYLTAIECYQANDKDILVALYEKYAYECYLTSNNAAAISYTQKSLLHWQEKNDLEKTGCCLSFLSRLWWLAGSSENAKQFAEQAVEVLTDQPSSSSKAMVFSNMSQLKMLSNQSAECIFWGEKAILIARELGDEEILCHALNNVGSAQMIIPASNQHGTELLQQSLAIALKNSYHDHVARAYCNITSINCTLKQFLLAKKTLEDGIGYCEERHLHAYTSYMVSWKASLHLETGLWTEAYRIVENLLKNENQAHAVKISALAVFAKLKMRRGDPDVVPFLLEAKVMAFETMELQRIIPVLTGLLEYEWLTGKVYIETEDIDRTITIIRSVAYTFRNEEFAFWLHKARKQRLSVNGVYEGFDLSSATKAMKAATLWRNAGCSYMEALALFEGNDNDKRKAIKIVHKLGAGAVYEKMRSDMRSSGIKSIPRGLRKSTRGNAAFLTGRELDVLALLRQELQSKEIAAKLYLSAKTIDNHISSIFSKLNVRSRTKAVTEAVRQEIIV